MKDPLDDIERPTLRERIEPYLIYNEQLAMALLRYQDSYGGAGIASPANHSADYNCENCKENVKGITKPNGKVIACPICGETPGMLTLGKGPE